MLKIFILNLFFIQGFVLDTATMTSSQIHETTVLNVDDLVYVVDDCSYQTYGYQCNKARPAKVSTIDNHGMVTVQFEDNNYGIYNEMDLYRTNGCLINIGTKLCVNTNRPVFVNSDLYHIDPLFHWTSFEGRILAINTYVNKAVVEPTSGGETLLLGIRAYDMDQMKLKRLPF